LTIIIEATAKETVIAVKTATTHAPNEAQDENGVSTTRQIIQGSPKSDKRNNDAIIMQKAAAERPVALLIRNLPSSRGSFDSI
jgi:hypothetical protein